LRVRTRRYKGMRSQIKVMQQKYKTHLDAPASLKRLAQP
jgi:hypothetical protein